MKGREGRRTAGYEEEGGEGKPREERQAEEKGGEKEKRDSVEMEGSGLMHTENILQQSPRATDTQTIRGRSTPPYL